MRIDFKNKYKFNLSKCNKTDLKTSLLLFNL